MNAARSIDPPAPPADAAAIAAAASLAITTPAANADAVDGWLAAQDASTCTRECGLWGVTFASSIRRAIAAGDITEADTLASIQLYVFDRQFAIAEAAIRDADQHINASKAKAGGA